MSFVYLDFSAPQLLGKLKTLGNVYIKVTCTYFARPLVIPALASPEASLALLQLAIL